MFHYRQLKKKKVLDDGFAHLLCYLLSVPRSLPGSWIVKPKKKI